MSNFSILVSLTDFDKKLASLYAQRQKEASLRWIQQQLKVLPYVVSNMEQGSAESLLKKRPFVDIASATYPFSPVPEDLQKDVQCIMQESEAVRKMKYGVTGNEMLVSVPNVPDKVKCIFHRSGEEYTCNFQFMYSEYIPSGDNDPMQYFAVELAEFLRDHGWGSFFNMTPTMEDVKKQALERSVPSFMGMIEYVNSWKRIFRFAWPELFTEVLERGQSCWNNHVREISASFDRALTYHVARQDPSQNN